jgi:hypothetical protein
MTRRLLLQNRKEDFKNEVLEKFGKITVGVHGKELPKYTAPGANKENKKEWWKYQNSYLESPRNFSYKLLR